MPRCPFRFAFALAGLGTASFAASGPGLPPLTADLAGKLFLPSLPALPALAWRLALAPAAAGRLGVELTATAAGLRLVARAELTSLDGDGSWRITAGEFDAAALLAAFAPQLGAALAGVRVEGRVLVSGEGTLHAGRPTGRLTLEWRDGAVRHAAQGWALQGVAFTGEFALDATGPEPRLTSATPFALTVRTITTARFGARNVLVRATLGEGLVLAIATASVDLAGGEVVADPFSLPLAPPVIDVNVHLNRIGLQDVAALVPAGLSDARGRVGGEVRLGWSQAGGFRLGAGTLTLGADEPATVRLAASPGLLSGNLPERFGFLPESAGVLARWLSLKNPAFAELRDIELGHTDLRVESLNVKLTPETDGRGRTASVEVTARSAKSGGSVDRISFEINVAGPLAAMLKIGLDDRASLKMK
jgi:hypothetical protein